jgi:hypothetical protein
MPETCWTVFKRKAINLRNCYIWLVGSFECSLSIAFASCITFRLDAFEQNSILGPRLSNKSPALQEAHHDIYIFLKKLSCPNKVCAFRTIQFRLRSAFVCNLLHSNIYSSKEKEEWFQVKYKKAHRCLSVAYTSASYVLVLLKLSVGNIFFLTYRVCQKESTRLRENVPYVKVHRYSPKYLYPKLNGYGNSGQRKVWSYCGSTYCTC